MYFVINLSHDTLPSMTSGLSGLMPQDKVNTLVSKELQLQHPLLLYHMQP